MQLVVLAAGMGSRYGGLKQIAPVDDFGNILMDYSIFDAKRAGINRVVFIIRRDLEKDFKEVIGNRVAQHMEVRYAYQELDMLPEGYLLPEGRTKPWGTAHAILCAKDQIDSDFAVINADDYYGPGAYKAAYDFLQTPGETNHANVAYILGKTLTENGHVARGICKVENGKLTAIAERTHIEKRPGGAAFTEDGENFTFIPYETLCSMNFFVLRHSLVKEAEGRFESFLKAEVPTNPLKCEFFLPKLANTLLQEGKATIDALSTDEQWYGVTYSDDMPVVKDALATMVKEGKYPEGLWK